MQLVIFPLLFPFPCPCFPLVMVASKEHCFYCFDVLIAHLENSKTPEPEFKDAE